MIYIKQKMKKEKENETMKKMNNKGFSLIELIIVIAIMAVLVAIIAPNLTKYLGKSKQQTDKTNLEEIKNQVKNCISDAATMQDASGNDILPQATDGSDAKYKISKGSSGPVVASVTNGTTEFAKLIEDVLDPDTTIASKASPTKKNIIIEIKGSASGGYSVSVSHS